jgi:hypothetical protein
MGAVFILILWISLVTGDMNSTQGRRHGYDEGLRLWISKNTMTLSLNLESFLFLSSSIPRQLWT